MQYGTSSVLQVSNATSPDVTNNEIVYSKRQGSITLRLTMCKVIMSAVYYCSRCPKVNIAFELMNRALKELQMLLQLPAMMDYLA